MKNEHDGGETIAVADTPDVQPVSTTVPAPNRHEQIEDICKKAAAGESLSIDDIGIVGEMDKADFDANVRRLRNVLEYQPIAGTAADREAAKKTLADVEARLADESLKIAAVIAEQQRLLASLKSTVKAKAAVVAKQEDAVARLRNCCPEHIEQYRQRQATIFNAQPKFNRMRELENRVIHIKSISKLDIAWKPDNEKAVSHAQSKQRNDLLTAEDLGRGLTHYELKAAKWVEYITGLQAELPTVESELATLQAEYAEGNAKFASVLDHYVPA